MRKGKPFILFTALGSALFIAVSARTVSLPRFALQSGLACSSCHVSMSGGLLRNEGGWYSSKKDGIFDPGKSFLAPIYAGEDNTLLGKNLIWGFDVRNQIAKRPSPPYGELKRKSFFMQAAPHLSYRPIENVELTGSYNFIDPQFPGQQRFIAYVTYKPVKPLAVEAGFLQPDFGIRHDDHTSFTRTLPGFYPYYQDLGVQVYANAAEWLTVSGGVFDTKHRREAEPFIKAHSIMTDAKVSAIRVVNDWSMSFMGGASALFEDGQTLYGVHAGAA